jgi:cytochrome c-type biogenesis protein CcmH/NrfG
MGKKKMHPPSPEKNSAPGVKPETLWLVVVIAFAVGFLAGVVFTIYKTPQPTGAGAVPGPMPAATAANDTQIDMVRRHLAQEPQDLKSWIQLGNLYFDAGRNAEAAAAYEKAIALDDTNPDVWTDLGVMYRRLGKPDQAIGAFDSAIAVDARHEVARYNKGVVLMHDLDRSQDAIAVWEELLEVNPLARTPDGRSLDAQVSQLKQQAGKNPAAAAGD